MQYLFNFNKLNGNNGGLKWLIWFTSLNKFYKFVKWY